MPLVVGICLIPLVILIMRKSNMVTTSKISKVILDIFLIVIALAFIIFCFVAKMEPFDFDITYSMDYMFYTGEWVLNAGIIFIFTPFMWIILIHFLKKIFRSIRVRKNAVIKKDEDFIYYRGDLDKISPSIIMFASTFDIDLKKSISATILKLKLTGYIEEKEGNYIYTNKDESTLLESEKMVLKLIRFGNFDKSQYKKVVEQETLKSKYIVKNGKGIFGRVLKIIIAIVIPIMIEMWSIGFDEYVFENYHVWPEKDNHAYIQLKDEDEIKQLYEEVKDKNDYNHRKMANGTTSYEYDCIRADKFEYSVVRKAFALNIFDAFIVGFVGIFVVFSLYIIIEQFIYINKNYRRTIKGKALLNKAYALKNYLKDYSMIKDRTEKELVLWEYYLVYSIVLGANVKIENEIIERYLKSGDC